MFKKLIASTLIAASVFVFPVISSAKEVTQNYTIQHVYYDKEDQMYYAITNNDEYGAWHLPIVKSAKFNKKYANALILKNRGKKVAVTYDDWDAPTNDCEWVLLEWKYIK